MYGTDSRLSLLGKPEGYSDQTVRMHRLIWVFASLTNLCLGFDVRRLIYFYFLKVSYPIFNPCVWMMLNMVRVNVKRKSAFKHVQNVRIHIIVAVRKVSSGLLLCIETFYSIQWYHLWTAKVLIKLRGYQTVRNLRCLHMPVDTLAHVTANMYNCENGLVWQLAINSSYEADATCISKQALKTLVTNITYFSK